MQYQPQQPLSPSTSHSSIQIDIRIKDPHAVIRDFFTGNHLQEVGDLLDYLFEKNVIDHQNPGVHGQTGGYEPGGLFTRLKAIKSALAASFQIHQGHQGANTTASVYAPATLSYQQVIKENAILAKVIDKTLQVLPADKIYLIDRELHDGKPRYKLLVCRPGKDRRPFPRYEKKITSSCKDIAVVCPFVLYSEELFIMLKNGHIFFSPVCTPEKLLYDNNRLVFAALDPQKTAQIAEEAQRTFDNAFQKAKFFLQDPRLQSNERPQPELLFNLHQTIEHTCRAILDSFSGYNLISHNLTRLFTEVDKYFPGLSQRICGQPATIELLQKAYYDARYRDMMVSAADWNTAMAQSLLFVYDVQKAISKKISAFMEEFG